MTRSGVASHRKPWSARASMLALFLVAAVPLLAGGKPWKSKPYSKWDRNDLRLILTDSPWVRIATIQRTWLPVSAKDVPPQTQIAGGVRSIPGGATGRPGGYGTTPARADEGTWRSLNVYIYWDSSRVLRAATARRAVLQGAMKAGAVQAYVAAPQPQYLIVLRMEDMTPFVRHAPAFYQSRTFLKTRKGKSKILPGRIVYERNPAGTLVGVLFYFPRQTATGAPTIAAGETDVQFFCRIARSTLRVDFKPLKMVDQFGGHDL